MTLLGRVRWAPAAKASPLLAAAGVRHGFAGVGDQPVTGRHHARQVHGTTVALTTTGRTADDTAQRIEADAVLTTARGEIVAVKTADCLPLLLVDEARTAAVAVHAGWRGLTAGIVGRAVAALAAHGVAPARILAAVGPAISRERFEVGAEVVQALLDPEMGLTAPDAHLCAAKGRGDRWHVDLAAAAALALARAGLAPERIEVVQACTNGDARWHSFRREGKAMGSNWSWVEL